MMCSQLAGSVNQAHTDLEDDSNRSDIEPELKESCEEQAQQGKHERYATEAPSSAEKSPSSNDGMSEVGLEADEEVESLSIPRRNSETEVLLNGRISRCTTESHSMRSDSDIDLSSDENSANRQLQMKLLTLERRLTEVTTELAEEKERRMCDTAHFQKDKEETLRKQELLVRDLERMKKEKEAAVMKYAKSEHEAITATKCREASEKKLCDMTKERDVYVTRVRALNQDYAKLHSRLEARASDLNKLERIIDRLTDEKSRAQERLHDLEKYCDKLLAEQQQELLKTTTEQSLEFSTKLEETKARLAECQRERDELYTRVTHLEDANRAHHENLSLSQIEIERLKAGLEQAIEDHANCPNREAESLQFTQQLTERTLKSQAENEQLKAQISLLTEDLDSFKEKNFNLDRGYADASERLRITSNECKCLKIRLADTERERDTTQRRVRELEHEKLSVKRKSEQNVKQLSKELQIARKHIDELDSKSAPKSNGKEILQLDQRVLVERIVKLQKNLARKTEKIEFLEEHVKELTAEVNRKRTR
ncbi:coiled-coil domain-containing protein 186 [Galendromus occidentalis]|uniref:Coiled-coil domain-containing protein 186 n=1 Tax=Galendromus occidentalis TaxID=34638 RepID=A0AAJ6QMP0_9ACAR|nr:coiled-coil domain-containing protein 186 [Galendromus occidentalis]